MAAQIAKQMAAVIPNIVIQVQQALAANPVNQVNQVNQVEPNAVNAPANSSKCSYKHFKSCDPPKYEGTEGVTALLRWFEEMESTFLNCDCPNDHKVRYATSRLKGVALTWWNAEKGRRGAEAAVALTWEQFKELMTKRFCPRSEIKKLEDEFYLIKQKDGDHITYNKRFLELNLMVPYLFTPTYRLVEHYTRGLPTSIQDSVMSTTPATLEAAMELATALTENHIRNGDFDEEKKKSSTSKTSAEPSKPTQTGSSSRFNGKRKRNGKNYAVTQTNQPNPPSQPIQAAPITQVAPLTAPPRKPYSGTSPKCNRCQYHHPAEYPCQHCTGCGRGGHTVQACRTTQRLARNQNQAQTNDQIVAQAPYQPPALMPPPAQVVAQPFYQPPMRACYNCGDPTHFRNMCPRLVNIINAQAQANPVNQANQANPPARGRAFNINANQARADNNVVNGTFLINGSYASILFDTGADKSFVSLEFESILGLPRVGLAESFTVEVADGEPITLDSIIRNCTLTLNEHDFSIDLIPM
ncbi:putative transcription factor interactor and regulator CCHC(Zn) family [Helianthus annuus]|nr:putative transcription factor interactor and regulator CCHC(Zn) family [Helianthus annuus]